MTGRVFISYLLTSLFLVCLDKEILNCLQQVKLMSVVVGVCIHSLLQVVELDGASLQRPCQ